MTDQLIGRGIGIGEAAGRAGISAQTLRLWERQGLLRPARTPGGHRVYTDEDLAVLERIRRLRIVDGLNYAAIRRALLTGDDGASSRDGRAPAGRANELPARLRQLRQQAHKTLKEVADATGFSVSFVSAVERGGSGLSIASLRKLAEYYDVEPRTLVGAAISGDRPLIRGHERSALEWDNGVRFEEMATSGRLMGPSLFIAPAGVDSGGFYSHGGEEFVYVIEGTLFIEVAGRGEFQLEADDTLYFPSTAEHRWWTTDAPARAVWVNMPPAQ